MTWNEIASFVCIGLSSIIFSISLQAKTKQKILIPSQNAIKFHLSKKAKEKVNC